MNAPALVTARPIIRPQYMNEPVTLETFERWFIVNSAALRGYWAEQQQLDDELTQSDFLHFCQCQYDIAKSPTSAVTACKSSSQGQKDDSADLGTAGVGALYPVTCRARYYDAASTILEDEPRLFSHDNANELGAVIQQWIERKRENWEPR